MPEGVDLVAGCSGDCPGPARCLPGCDADSNRQNGGPCLNLIANIHTDRAVIISTSNIAARPRMIRLEGGGGGD